ncbi:hypothetical protein EDD99_8148 [Streptomyces sp. 846.5]|nr:hypothetical protein [Streptomyces sp. 846.5]TDT93338.1 hypothetical protein EDD99_8148 [Streptomyces sp. 846.5]
MTTFAQITAWPAAHPLPATIGVSALIVVAVAAVLRRIKSTTRQTERRKFSAGTVAAAVAFVICTSVSLNTSYGFTFDGLQMRGTPERLLSCAAFESLIAMCVLGARERLNSEKQSPGWFGSAVWIFAALSAVPAWHEGHGLTPGTIVRVIVGSFGAGLAAHSALGLELRHRSGAESQSPMALIMRDLRERLMARLGVGQRGRTAEKIARDRALSKAVDLADRYDRLSEEDKAKDSGARIARRLARALDRAGCYDDEAQQAEYRARVALRRFATELKITPDESPWHIEVTSPEAESAIAELEARIRHMEDLAEETEAAVAARIEHAAATTRADLLGTRAEVGNEAPAAADLAHPPAPVRVPKQSEHQDEALKPQPVRDLRSYPTKRAALEALFALRIAPDDTRVTNVITEELLKELADAGVQLDRGAAHRYVTDLRPSLSQEDDQAEDSAVQGSLVNA